MSDAGPQIAALTRDPVEEEESAVSSHKSQIGKKFNRRAERQHQHIPTIFAIVPDFAATAAATTTSLFRLR